MEPQQTQASPQTNIPGYSYTEQPSQPQKKSIWWKIVLGIGCLLFILGICGFCIYATIASQSFSSMTSAKDYTVKTLSGEATEKVAIIDVKGVITDFSGTSMLDGSSMSSAEGVNEMIDYAIDNQKANAILFRLNTPGGNFTAAETVCNKINEVRAEGIYTMAWIHTQGASGGYYIASCTDWIITREDAITGSIGVMVQLIDVNAFLENIGFRVKTLANTNSSHKASGDIYSEDSTDEQIMISILDESYNKFIDVIVAGRKDKEKNLTRADIVALSDGRIYSGKQAYENGLIDEVGYQQDAINSIIEKAELPSDTRVIVIEQDTGFWSGLASSALGKLKPIAIDYETPGIRVMAISPL